MDGSGTVGHHGPGSGQMGIISIRPPANHIRVPLTAEAQNAGNCLWDPRVPTLYGTQAPRGTTAPQVMVLDSKEREEGPSVPRRLPLSFPKCLPK